MPTELERYFATMHTFVPVSKCTGSMRNVKDPAKV